MENVSIRPLKSNDNETLARVIRDVFVEHDAPRKGTVYSDPTTDNLSELFKQRGSVLWVAEQAGELLGCCGIYPTEGLPDKCAELVKFYLANKARGKGIGRKLLTMSFDSARELGYSHLYLESLPHFGTAVSIYEKMGFVTLDQPMGDSQHPTCNIWMLKML